MVRGVGEACRRILIQDNEGASCEGAGQRRSTGVGERRMPGGVVGIEVPDDKRVGVVDKVEERGEIEAVTRRAGRRRRYVEIEDVSRDVVELDGDADDLGGGVIDEGAVDFGEGEGVVDEETHSTPTTIGARAMKKRVAGDVDVGVWAKFRFLDGGHGDFVFVEELAEFDGFSRDAVAVPLKY